MKQALMNSCKFDKDYFEHGREKHLSWYENFRWTPSISFSIASVLNDLYPNKSILDFGCAKGYIVKALRDLGVDACGYDISEYAISCAPDDIKKYVSSTTFDSQDIIFSKDVLEHIPYEEILDLTVNLADHCGERALIIVPLAENGVYRAAEYELDVTHVIREDESWWCDLFKKSGFTIKNMYYSFHGIKQFWTEKYPYSNGFFLLEK